jgi:hypothetical protein
MGRDAKAEWDITYQCTDNQHRSRLVVMFSGSDDVPFLTVRAVTGGGLDRGKIGAEVS